ncbi:HAD family phosphatase [Paenibacillus psychroresistens]|uniref:HAD family phosphatase n=1 Tax=Paenibacillus psychroresistens TaxID=1778678 RepID=A0A6B8RVS0_9BACL|nr:HAD family hydrolase [Paenibacillus psychroresistens]QGQ99238.1 HAD family phosphatase [Paenibacillus psychroresistens]
MQKLYILTDLDGTLLRSSSLLSDFSKEVFTAALEAGHVVSYATARSYISSQTKVSTIPWQFPIILYNGALIFDPLSQATVGGAWLSHDITNEVISLGKSFDQVPFLFLLDENQHELVLHEPLRRIGEQGFYDSRPNDRRFHEMPLLHLNHLDKKVMILTYIGAYEDLKPFYDALKLHYGTNIYIHFSLDTYLQDQYFLEVSDPLANKGAATLRWAELVGCLPEQIIVFGDNFNDIEMFEVAGTTIAMSNARTELKEKADSLIVSNDEDGVAHYIQTLL